MKFVTLASIAALTVALSSFATLAAEHEIKIKNTNGKGKFMVFEPDFLKVAPGDTVKFVLVDKTTTPRRSLRSGRRASSR